MFGSLRQFSKMWHYFKGRTFARSLTEGVRRTLPSSKLSEFVFFTHQISIMLLNLSILENFKKTGDIVYFLYLAYTDDNLNNKAVPGTSNATLFSPSELCSTSCCCRCGLWRWWGQWWRWWFVSQKREAVSAVRKRRQGDHKLKASLV